MKKSVKRGLYGMGLIVALGVLIAPKIETPPHGDMALRSWSRIATVPNLCEDCNVIEFFWQNKESTDCTIKKVEITIDGKIISKEDRTVEKRIEEKGTKLYSFDVEEDRLFKQYCFDFPNRTFMNQ